MAEKLVNVGGRIVPASAIKDSSVSSRAVSVGSSSSSSSSAPSGGSGSSSSSSSSSTRSSSSSSENRDRSENKSSSKSSSPPAPAKPPEIAQTQAPKPEEIATGELRQVGEDYYYKDAQGVVAKANIVNGKPYNPVADLAPKKDEKTDSSTTKEPPTTEYNPVAKTLAIGDKLYSDVEGFTKSASGEVIGITTKQNGTSITFDPKTGKAITVQNQSAYYDVQNNQGFFKDKLLTPINPLREEGYNALTGFGLKVNLDKSAKAQTDFYYKEVDAQAQREAKDLASETAGQLNKFLGGAQYIKTTETPEGIIVKINENIKSNPNLENELATRLARGDSILSNVQVIQKGPGEFLVKASPAPEKEYLLSKGFKGNTPVEIGAGVGSNNYLEPTFKLASGETKTYSQLSSEQKAAVDANYSETLGKITQSIATQIGQTNLASPNIRFEKIDGTYRLTGLPSNVKTENGQLVVQKSIPTSTVLPGSEYTSFSNSRSSANLQSNSDLGKELTTRASEVFFGQKRAEINEQAAKLAEYEKPQTLLGQNIYAYSQTVGKAEKELATLERYRSDVPFVGGAIETGVKLAAGIGSLGLGAYEAASAPILLAAGAGSIEEAKLRGIKDTSREAAAFGSAIGYSVGGISTLPITAATFFGASVVQEGLAAGLTKVGAPTSAVTLFSSGGTQVALDTSVRVATGQRVTVENTVSSFGLGLGFGGVSTLSEAGLVPKPGIETIKYEVKTPTPVTKGATTLYVEAGGKAQPLVSLQEYKPVLGAPKIVPEGVTKFPLPETPIQTTVLKPALQSYGKYLSTLTPEETIVARQTLTEFAQGNKVAPSSTLEYYSPIKQGLGVAETRFKTGSQLMEFVYTSKDPAKLQSGFKEVLRETDLFKKPGAAEKIESIFQKEGSDAVIYGSVPQKMVLGEAMTRTPKDIDVMLSKGSSEVFAQKLVKELEPIYKSDIRVSAEKPSLVEIKNPETGKFQHGFDVHSKGGDIVTPGESTIRADYFGYGLKTKAPFVSKEGYAIISLSEQGGRKFSSTLTPREFGFGPEAHRLKDVFDALQISEFKGRLQNRPDIVSAAGEFRKTIPAELASQFEQSGSQYGIILKRSSPEASPYAAVALIGSPLTLVGSGANQKEISAKVKVLTEDLSEKSTTVKEVLSPSSKLVGTSSSNNLVRVESPSVKVSASESVNYAYSASLSSPSPTSSPAGFSPSILPKAISPGSSPRQTSPNYYPSARVSPSASPNQYQYELPSPSPSLSTKQISSEISARVSPLYSPSAKVSPSPATSPGYSPSARPSPYTIGSPRISPRISPLISPSPTVSPSPSASISASATLPPSLLVKPPEIPVSTVKETKPQFGIPKNKIETNRENLRVTDRRGFLSDLFSIAKSQLLYGEATNPSPRRRPEYYNYEQKKIPTIELLERRAPTEKNLATAVYYADRGSNRPNVLTSLTTKSNPKSLSNLSGSRSKSKNRRFF